MKEKTDGEIRIFVVDDHPVVHDGLKMILGHEDDILICGAAFNANDAVAKIDDASPHIAIIDIELKGGISGIELTRALKNRMPDLDIIMLSMYDESIYAERSLRAGARGYIMKSQMTGEVVKAIRHVYQGNIFLSEPMTTMVIDNLLYDHEESIGDTVEKLTNREFEIFHLIGQGFGTTDMSRKLNLSIKTIDTYKGRIKGKLNLRNNADLLKFAVEWNRGR